MKITISRPLTVNVRLLSVKYKMNVVMLISYDTVSVLTLHEEEYALINPKM